MRYGVLLAGDDILTWRSHLPSVREGGFWGIGIGDSPSLYPDPYVQATVAALDAPGLRVGPWVSNPVTRHPAVTARALHSIDLLTGGGAFLGIGTGDSAVRNIGRQPADLALLGRYCTAVRDLLGEGGADWDGAEVRFKERPRRVPIYVAASGPRGLELAGRVGDGVIVGSGLEPEMVTRALEAIDQGARASHRSLSDLDLWWPVVAGIADQDEEALGLVKAHLVTYAHFGLRTATEWSGVPPELVQPAAAVQDRYRPIDHAESGAGSHADLVDELGLGAFLQERFAVAGSPAAVVRRIAELERRGVTGIWVSLRMPDKATFLHRWRTEVLPHLGRGPRPT